ncbi:DUF885 domain-containing protein [Sphingosinicella rhizophila]|uniref:DUF885 domain-containing protein n=1 Tax=Sphingosinicella rhizophila TaxID=3050082 RepID=A0ABU3Q9F6_9SPHN|nr:DUF885 domain-containing protein [Sphingosinicella sp. GR2756]MDT9599927.1 DUF885 domain-containing protein [Sphingosinicella sp. GR2756]
MMSEKATIDQLAADYWQALVLREPYYALMAGERVERFPSGSLAGAEAAADTARTLLARLDAIDLSNLDRGDSLTAEFLRYMLESDTSEPDRWWTSFGIAPYSASGLSMMPSMLFAPIDVTKPEEAQRYLQLVADFAGAIDALREKTEAQAERGWRLPKPALPGARITLESIGAAATASLALSTERTKDEALRADVDRLIEEKLKPAFTGLLAAIGEDYEAVAPEEVGICHQPGGADAYRDWLRYHLSFDASPEEIHEIGKAEVEHLTAAMAKLRLDAFGHNGDEAAFHERLRQDPRAKAESPEALEAIYRRHLERMAPVFARIVRKAPQASATVKRLAPEMEAGMTFGYYAPPSGSERQGIYHYSGNGIPDRLQMNAAPLIFHELVPGHHVHITRQAENEALPDVRRRTFIFGAFNEGWAEYSAGLGEEAGLYDDPYDLYGWLSHQRFVAQRLVVDTGLNFYGWSLQKARDYMSANTLESETQVASETLRYATDMPGQALGYRMGFLKFRELREKARARLGESFDLADFHEAILEQGALPIELLEKSLDDWASERLRA